MIALGPGDAAQLHGGALRDQQERAWCRLAEYSRDCLRALRAATGIAYDERMQGTLQLFRTQKQLDGSAGDIAVLQRSGVAFELLDRAGCIRHEPALARVQREVRRRPAACPATRPATASSSRSASPSSRRSAASTFRYGTTIQRARCASGDRITGVATDAGHADADAYLVALGSYSPLLLAPLGIRIPVYPVKGYSITVPITDAAGAPESTVMDETHKVAVTRLGDRIRVGGTAELAGYTLQAARGAPDDARARRRPTSSRAAATSRAPSSGAACGR